MRCKRSSFGWKFFEFQDFTTFEDGLVLVVDDGIAIGLILGTMENKINTKLLFHNRSEFFFVGSHVAVLQEDGSKLFPSLFIGFESLAVLLDDTQRQGLDNVPITLDTKIIILGIALVAAGFEDGLELVDRRETVLQSFLDGIGSPLFLVLAHNAVDDFLRTDAFLIVVYLVAIGSHTARHYMNMVVVSIVMGVDENRLAVLSIAHFFEVLMGDV